MCYRYADTCNTQLVEGNNMEWPRFDEMVSCAKRTMEEVKKKENPDVIVGLFHSGWNGGIKTPQYDEDASQKVAQEVPGSMLSSSGMTTLPIIL